MKFIDNKIVSKFLLIAVVVLSFSSCFFEQENLFDQSASERLSNTITKDFELLVAAESGWVMNYFATPTSEGFPLLMKFNKDHRVEMMMNNRYSENSFLNDTSFFDIIADNSVVLTFNTFNKVLHKFADPADLPETPIGANRKGDETGVGLEGDYEFMIMAVSPDKIQMKGKKRATRIELVRLPENQDWREYFKRLDELNFTRVYQPALQMNIGNAVYTLKPELPSNIFSTLIQGGDPVVDVLKVPFLRTDYGIRFHQPFVVADYPALAVKGGASAYQFLLSEDKSYLYSIDNEQDRIVSAQTPSEFFLDPALWAKGIQWKVDTSELGGDFATAYEKIATNWLVAFPTVGLESFYFYRNSLHKRVLRIQTKTEKTYGTVNFDIEVSPNNSDRVVFAFQGVMDNNAKNFVNKVEGVNTFLELLNANDFEVSANLPLTPSKIKFISTANPNNWFTLICN
jgi:hypothetical protein